MPRDHDYFIYLATNASRVVLYIGMTNDLERRMSEHRLGEVAGFTERYHVDRLVYHEHFREVRDALARETQLKNWSRAKKNALVEKLNPKWADLAVELGFRKGIAAKEANDGPGLGGPSTALGMTNNYE